MIIFSQPSVINRITTTYYYVFATTRVEKKNASIYNIIQLL